MLGSEVIGLWLFPFLFLVRLVLRKTQEELIELSQEQKLRFKGSILQEANLLMKILLLEHLIQDFESGKGLLDDIANIHLQSYLQFFRCS